MKAITTVNGNSHKTMARDTPPLQPPGYGRGQPAPMRRAEMKDIRIEDIVTQEYREDSEGLMIFQHEFCRP
jgi:hypothetical protein